MKFIVIRLLTNPPDPSTGRRASATEVLGDAVEEASYFEELGFDGYGIGEHHIDDAEASSPAVILGYLAASTKRIRLFTGVTVLSLLDPVRVAEDYATVDVLSGGRVDLIIGKGNTEEQSRVFGYTNDDQWDRNRENYELLHRLLREERVTWEGVYRPALDAFTSRPRPIQQPIRVWHGSATSTQSTELAAKWGDPLFSANVSGPLEQYQALVDDYRKRWVDHGRDPADALVGAGSAGLHVHRDSRRAVEEFRPRYELQRAFARRLGVPSTFTSLEDAIERGSYFVGSPAQVVDQVSRYHDALGHEVQHTAGIGRPDDPISRAGIELFAAEVLPQLQRDLPDRLWDRWPATSDTSPVDTATALPNSTPQHEPDSIEPREEHPMTTTEHTSTRPDHHGQYASAVDTERFGEYRITQQPDDPRPLYRFEGRISNDGSTPYAAEAGRYHIYSGWFCPWAQRVTIAHALAGLEDVVSVSYVDGARDARGWAFRSTYGPDPVNGFTLLRDAYEATEPGFDGHVSVPTLWDRVTGRVVSNQFRTIGIDLATQFGALATPVTDTYPADLADEIEELDAWIGPNVNRGVNAVGGDGVAAADARGVLLDTFRELDERLHSSRFLLGDRLTEADIRLFVTLVRYDHTVNTDRTINGGLAEFPNLWAYARDLYSIPAFRDTTDFTSFAALASWNRPAHRGDLITVAA